MATTARVIKSFFMRVLEGIVQVFKGRVLDLLSCVAHQASLQMAKILHRESPE